MRNVAYDDRQIGNQGSIWMIDAANLALPVNTDIPFYKIGGFSEWYALSIRAWGASSLPNLQFGIFTGAGGTGTAIVAAGATFTGMTTPLISYVGGISTGNLQTSDTLFLRVTAANTGACNLQGLVVIGVPTLR